MRKLAILVMVVGLVFTSMPVAMANNSHQLKGTIEGPTTGFIPDPAAVAARCPDGFEAPMAWILQTAGTGELTTLGYTGPVTYSSEHCSRWLTFPDGKTVGKVGDGLLTMSTPSGDQLNLSYNATFVFEGDLSIMVWETKVNMRYTIVGGTGVFEGASGRGHFAVTDNSGYGTGGLEGSLVYHH